MSSLLAVDVILRLPEEIEDLAIHYNRRLSQLSEKRIDLNNHDCLPHISLTMGVIEDSQITDVTRELKEIAQEYLPLALTVCGFYKQSTCGFEIEKTAVIQQLHMAVVTMMKPLVQHQATKVMFLGEGGKVSNANVDWVNSYFDKSSGSNFFPHITLGYADAPQLDESIQFTASTLALCHLGKHCTCREVIGEVKV